MRNTARSADRLELATEITRALLRSPTVEEAGTRLLEVLCRQTGWSCGALWLVDEDLEELRCRAFWPQVGMEPFHAANRLMRFQRGAGRLGQVWASGRPVWVPDVSGDALFLRQQVAEQTGLCGSFTAPVLAGGRAIGALELYLAKPSEPCDRTLSALTAMAAEIGSALQRLDDHALSATAGDALSRLVAEGKAALFFFDRDGRLRVYGGCAEQALGINPLWLQDQPAFEKLPPGHPLCRNLARALAGERLSDRLEPPGSPRSYELNYLPCSSGHVIEGVLAVALAVTATAQERQAAREIDTRAAIVAARLLVSRLLSFERSRRPLRPENEHRLELLEDAHNELHRAEHALSRRPRRVRRRSLSSRESGPIPIPIAREDTNSGSVRG